MNDQTHELSQLVERIQAIHLDCVSLCLSVLGRSLENARNVGVFCRTLDEYQNLLEISQGLIESDDNPDRKYFRLLNDIIIPGKDSVTGAAYQYLYIRKPAADTPQAGDVDFILSEMEYAQLKNRLLAGESIDGARIYNQPGLDMIELGLPDVDALAYVSTRETTEKVRFRIHQ